MTNVAYLRVSDTDQNLDRQRDIVSEGMRVFEDKCSGSTTHRPGLSALLDWVRAGDHVHVHSIDRMARDLLDLQTLVKTFKAKGVSLTFHKEQLHFSAEGDDAMSMLMLQIFGAVAQFERARIRERQAEGIAKAKQRGVYSKTRNGTKAKGLAEQVLALKAEGMGASAIAKQLGIARSSVYNILNTATAA